MDMMISCSTSWLIKLGVVFFLNMSLFTTGTAPPLNKDGKEGLVGVAAELMKPQAPNYQGTTSASTTLSSISMSGSMTGEVLQIKPTLSIPKISKAKEQPSLQSLSNKFQDFSAQKSKSRPFSELISSTSSTSSTSSSSKGIIESTSTPSVLNISESRGKLKFLDSNEERIQMSRNALINSDAEVNMQLNMHDESSKNLLEALEPGLILEHDFTPEVIAQYIFLTGDEAGVVNAISELINDGFMMSRETTIKFLEDTQQHLMHLNEKYQDYLKMEKGVG